MKCKECKEVSNNKCPRKHVTHQYLGCTKQSHAIKPVNFHNMEGLPVSETFHTVTVRSGLEIKVHDKSGCPVGIKSCTQCLILPMGMCAWHR